MNSYPSKILLFGEYTILLNGEGLAIPIYNYTMEWVTFQKSDDRLFQFAKFLHGHSHLTTQIDVESFQECVSAGNYLESNIPVGYGLGSSGAVCAAVYDRFGKEKELAMKPLRVIFQEMESFFHGQSSGLDPLVSYYKKAFWIKDEFEIIECNPDVMNRFHQLNIFMLDSGISRSSKHFIELFKSKLLKKDFEETIKKKISIINQQIINNWIQNDIYMIKENWKMLSAHSFDAFNEMIVPSVREIWKKGIDTGGYYLKLCGAGGGGFYLALVEDEILFQKDLNHLTAIRLEV